MKIFQILTGNTKLLKKYLDYSHDSFQKLNPDIECIKLIYDVQDYYRILNKEFANEYDQLLYNAIIRYKNYTIENIEKDFKTNIKEFIYLYIRYNSYTRICDYFRWELLWKYKDCIYLDIDTYPIKPFDDYFFENYHCGNNNNDHHNQRDSWFINLKAKNHTDNIYQNPIFCNHYTLQDRKNIQNDFLNMNVKSPYKKEDENYYFYHFYSSFKYI